MKNLGEGTLPYDVLWQQEPLIQYFPELEPLGQDPNCRVPLQIRGVPYSLMAEPYLNDGMWTHKDYYRLVFALLSEQGLPTAYADYKIPKRGNAECEFRSPHIPDALKTFLKRVSLPEVGFAVRRDLKARGLGETLLACSLLVLESRGVKRANFVTDNTFEERGEGNFKPIWYTYGNSGDFGLIDILCG